MSSFSRNLSEDLAVQSFLNSETPFGFGPHKFFPLFLQPAIGSFASRSIVNQDGFGNRTPDLREVSNFNEEGSSTDVPIQMFDEEGDPAHSLAQMFDPSGGETDGEFGLDYPRNLTGTLSLSDAVDFGGDFTRGLSEALDLFARTGQSKALFFRQDFSGVVSANSQVRQLLPIQDTGEIAASERPISGSLRVMRYEPGTNPGAPNTVDLGSLPTNVGSQGFIFDNSPQGVFLRGAWQVDLVVSDTSSTGSYTVSVNLFVVTANTTGVAKVLQIGATKTSSPVIPSATPTQITFDWTAGEVGEIFIDSDQYMYVETFVLELSHPSTLSYAKLRLDDLPHTSFSELHFPGVSDETTYNLDVDSESLSVSDGVARILGFNRDLAEAISVLESLAKTVGFQQNLSEAISISDLLVAAINVLYETLSISDSVDRVADYTRNLSEVLTVAATVSVNVPSPKLLIENLLVRDHVSFSIRKPDKKGGTDGIDKRRLDSLKRLSNRRRG